MSIYVSTKNLFSRTQDRKSVVKSNSTTT